jgi:hypothetical protein
MRRSWKRAVLISRTLQLYARSWRPRPDLKQFTYTDIEYRNQKLCELILIVIITELCCSIDYPICTTLMNPVLDRWRGRWILSVRREEYYDILFFISLENRSKLKQEWRRLL